MQALFHSIRTEIWYKPFPFGEEKTLIESRRLLLCVVFFLFPSFLSFSFLQIFMSPIYEAQVLSEALGLWR